MTPPIKSKYITDKNRVTPSTPRPKPIQIVGISLTSGNRIKEAINANKNRIDMPRKRSTTTDEALFVKEDQIKQDKWAEEHKCPKCGQSHMGSGMNCESWKKAGEDIRAQLLGS